METSSKCGDLRLELRELRRSRSWPRVQPAAERVGAFCGLRELRPRHGGTVLLRQSAAYGSVYSSMRGPSRYRRRARSRSVSMPMKSDGAAAVLEPGHHVLRHQGHVQCVRPSRYLLVSTPGGTGDQGHLLGPHLQHQRDERLVQKTLDVELR